MCLIGIWTIVGTVGRVCINSNPYSLQHDNINKVLRTRLWRTYMQLNDEMKPICDMVGRHTMKGGSMSRWLAKLFPSSQIFWINLPVDGDKFIIFTLTGFFSKPTPAIDHSHWYKLSLGFAVCLIWRKLTWIFTMFSCNLQRKQVIQKSSLSITGTPFKRY